MKQYDLIIIGAGASGMLVATECKKQGMKDILVIEKNIDLGGALLSANYNIFRDFSQTGQDYLKGLKKEYEDAEIETLLSTMVLNITPDGNVVCTNATDGVTEYSAKKILIANGGKEKGRAPLNMTGDRVVGTFSLAVAKMIAADDSIVLGKTIAIVGIEHLDSIEQTFLEHGVKVAAIINPSGDSFSFAPAADGKIYDGYEVTRLLGDGRLSSLELKKDRTVIEIPCDTLLFATGWLSDGIVPMRSDIALNPETTGAKVNANYETSRENIYACGNGIYIHDCMEELIEESKKVAEILCK